MSSKNYPAAANVSWRVNSFDGTRSVDFLSRFNVLEDVTRTPTSIKFSGPCPFATLVQCFSGPGGTGSMTAINVPPNFAGPYPVSFQSWRVIKR